MQKILFCLLSSLSISAYSYGARATLVEANYTPVSCNNWGWIEQPAAMWNNACNPLKTHHDSINTLDYCKDGQQARFSISGLDKIMWEGCSDLPNQPIFILNKFTAGYMDVQSGVDANGTPIITWPKTNQKWLIKPQGCVSGCIIYWNPTTGLSNKVLTIKNQSKKNGGELYLWDNLGEDHQRFSLINIKADFYIIKSDFSGLRVENKKQNSVQLIQYDCNQADHQLWKIN